MMIAVLLTATPALSVSRGALLRGAGAASLVTTLLPPGTANALLNEPADNEIVPTQKLLPDKLDVNNSPVADYMKVSLPAIIHDRWLCHTSLPLMSCPHHTILSPDQ